MRVYGLRVNLTTLTFSDLWRGGLKTGGSIPGQEILDCENPCFLGGKYTEDIRT